MSVTTTSYTANTKKITVINEFGNASTNIIAAVESAITGAGWSLYDTINTTLFNPMVTKVYRVQNFDGVTYKYIILRWDTLKMQLYTSCCELWNLGTHTATNESWSQAGAFVQGYDIANSFFLVNASARHCMIWPWIMGQPGLWTAVVEFERVAPEDIAMVSTTPVPCFAWTCSIMMGTPYGNWNTGNNVSPNMFCFPRTYDGSVGYAAASVYAPITNRGMWPPNYPQASQALVNDPLNNLGHLGSYNYNLVYGWNTASIPASTIAVDAGTTFTNPSGVVNKNNLLPFGRMYNFGITGTIGRPGDTVLANIDTTYGWPTATTTQTECLLLPLNGGSEASGGTFYNQYNQGYPNSGTYSYINGNLGPSVTPIKSIAVGDTVFVATGNGSVVSGTYNNTGGIVTFSLSSGSNQPPTFRVNVGSNSGGIGSSIYPYGGVYDIMFDGNNYVYATTANGILQMNANTFSTVYWSSNQTIANGCGYLSMDNKNVYAGCRTYSGRPQVYTFDRSTGNVYFGNTYNPPSNLSWNYSTTWGTPTPDYTGNVYIQSQSGSNGSNYFWLSTFSANTGGNIMSIASPAATNSGGNPNSNTGAYGLYYDYVTGRFWTYCLYSNYYYIQECYALQGAQPSPMPGMFSGNLLAITNAGLYNNQGTINYQYGCLNEYNVPDYRGEAYVVPFRGLHYMSIKKAFNADLRTTNNTNLPVLLLLSGQSTLIGGNVALGGITATNIYAFQAVTSSIKQTPLMGCKVLTTNGVNLYATFTSPNGNFDNNVLMISGMYTGTNVYGWPTSKLILRG